MDSNAQALKTVLNPIFLDSLVHSPHKLLICPCEGQMNTDKAIERLWRFQVHVTKLPQSKKNSDLHKAEGSEKRFIFKCVFFFINQKHKKIL